MANDSTVDQQQLQSTIDDLWRRLTDLVKVQLGAINVGDNQALGFLSTIDDLANAPVGDQAAFLQAVGLGVLVPALNGTAADLRSALELGVAATGDAATVRSALELGTASTQPDSRYAKLLGSNDFGTMPAVGGSPIVESGSNSNGRYVRYADGTQICYRSMTIYYDVSYRLRSQWVFPVSFSAAPVVNATAPWGNRSISTNNRAIVKSGQSDLSVTNVAAWATGDDSWTSGDYLDQVDVVAIGRWK